MNEAGHELLLEPSRVWQQPGTRQIGSQFWRKKAPGKTGGRLPIAYTTKQNAMGDYLVDVSNGKGRHAWISNA
jgi:hypothetical protein